MHENDQYHCHLTFEHILTTASTTSCATREDTEWAQQRERVQRLQKVYLRHDFQCGEAIGIETSFEAQDLHCTCMEWSHADEQADPAPAFESYLEHQ